MRQWDNETMIFLKILLTNISKVVYDDSYMKNSTKGFTLIELLIVIALLGALAVGLLAALDPFEQLKKGTDTGTQNTVSEIQGAIIRYFSIKTNMPWCPTGVGCPADPTGNPLSEDPMKTALTEIISTGELKSDFASLAANNLNKIFVTGSQTNSTVTVCYKPTSKSFIANPNTKFTKDGADTCGTADPTHATCYWCVK